MITYAHLAAFPRSNRGYLSNEAHDGHRFPDCAAACPANRARGARVGRAPARWTAAMLFLRAPLSHSGRARGGLPRPLQRRGRSARPVGIRRGPAVRSDREEAVLPRAAGNRRALLRDARLRPALRVLPELVHVAVRP